MAHLCTGSDTDRDSRLRPGEKHWHGAAPTTAMAHIAIVEKAAENSTEWMEKVSDEQYLAVSETE